MLLWGIGEGMFAYFQAIYLESLGARPLQIGLIFGLAGAVLMLVHIPAGTLADTVGRRSMMIASWVIATLACWVMFASTSLALFSAALVAYFMTSFVMAPLSSYISSARGSWPASRALTTVFATYNAGAVFGPLVGGAAAAVLGLRSVYGLAGMVFVVSTVLILFIRPQPRETPIDAKRYGNLIRNRPLARFLGLAFLAMFATYLPWPLTPNYLQSTHGVSLAVLGTLGAFNAFGGVVLNLTLGRTRPLVGLVLSQGLAIVSAAILWQANLAPWFALAYFLAAGFRSAHSMVTAHVDGMVGRAELGLAFGLVETVLALVILTAPPTAGVLYQISPSLPYPVGILLMLGSVAISIAYARHHRPPEEHLEIPIVERIPGGG
jgi:MFS family permease